MWTKYGKEKAQIHITKTRDREIIHMIRIKKNLQKDQIRQFCHLGDKKVIFNLKDRIFSLSGPINESKQSNQCSKRAQGSICKICDRKFILYSNYSHHSTRIEQQDELIDYHYSQVTELNEEYAQKSEKLQGLKDKLTKNHNNYIQFERAIQAQLDEIELQEDKYQDDISDMKLKLKLKSQDLELKNEEITNLKSLMKELEIGIEKERHMLEHKTDQIVKVKESIYNQRIKNAVSRSQAMPLKNETKRSMLISNYQPVDDVIEEFEVVDNEFENQEHSDDNIYEQNNILFDRVFMIKDTQQQQIQYGMGSNQQSGLQNYTQYNPLSTYEDINQQTVMGSLIDNKIEGTSIVGFGSRPRDKSSLKNTSMSSPKTNHSKRGQMKNFQQPQQSCCKPGCLIVQII
ncbi:UNKNOWN [Stylonychia lemnae]|uniref:Uncharacterized protein n=1 Tax=Stylonychia lemnae TaxID=5949 RepID=A0A078AA85_STYLE|nr:UNKNOWN [Stylonychia lemnae]|eukprot:CDW79170.1 UNKNOWN [Stylonychia lemnae]